MDPLKRHLEQASKGLTEDVLRLQGEMSEAQRRYHAAESAFHAAVRARNSLLKSEKEKWRKDHVVYALAKVGQTMQNVDFYRDDDGAVYVERGYQGFLPLRFLRIGGGKTGVRWLYTAGNRDQSYSLTPETAAMLGLPGPAAEADQASLIGGGE